MHEGLYRYHTLLDIAKLTVNQLDNLQKASYVGTVYYLSTNFNLEVGCPPGLRMQSVFKLNFDLQKFRNHLHFSLSELFQLSKKSDMNVLVLSGMKSVSLEVLTGDYGGYHAMIAAFEGYENKCALR
jgi:hypothetical protein